MQLSLSAVERRYVAVRPLQATGFDHQSCHRHVRRLNRRPLCSGCLPLAHQTPRFATISETVVPVLR